MPRLLVIQARKAKKLTQAGLASLMGVPTSTVSRVELGYQDPTEEEASKIVELLGIRRENVDAGLPKGPKMPTAPIRVPVSRGLARATRPEAAELPAAPAAISGEKVVISIAPAPLPEQPVVISGYDREPDLSNPAKFNLLPDTGVLETAGMSSDQARSRLSRALKVATTILHTSRVPAAIWSQWRSFEKTVEARLKQL